jgi:hypothetical protein
MLQLDGPASTCRRSWGNISWEYAVEAGLHKKGGSVNAKGINPLVFLGRFLYQGVSE